MVGNVTLLLKWRHPDERVITSGIIPHTTLRLYTKHRSQRVNDSQGPWIRTLSTIKYYTKQFNIINRRGAVIVKNSNDAEWVYVIRSVSTMQCFRGDNSHFSNQWVENYFLFILFISLFIVIMFGVYQSEWFM